MPETKHSLKVFLYHAPSDKEEVRNLYLRLIQDGVDAWLVKDRLLPAQDWQHEIRQTIGQADVVIVCLSQHFEQAGVQKKAARAAFDSAIEQMSGEIFLLPVRLEEWEQIEVPGAQPSVDVFEEGGYEALMQVLQARAETVGAAIQRKEGSLPPLATSSTGPGKLPPEKSSLAVQQGTHGILIEGSDVKLESSPASPARRRLGRVTFAALAGLVSIIVATVLIFPSPQLARWYRLSLMVLTEPSIAGASARLKSKVSPKAPPANIVFLIDTSKSMQGEIDNIKAVLTSFISRLDDRYPVSIITYNAHVEMETGLTLSHAEAGDAIQFIDVTVQHDGVCLNDALYTAVQETARTPLENDAQSIVILLNDNGWGESGSCHFHVSQDVMNAVAKHPASIFDVHIGTRTDGNSYLAVKTGGASFGPGSKDKKGLERALYQIVNQKLGMKIQAMRPVPLPATTSGVEPASMIYVPEGEFLMGHNQVSLDSFWIDKMEVTNLMYSRCVRAGICHAPHSDGSNTQDSYYGNGIFDDYPVIYVSWLDANAYCSWAGKRLPTEAEWEKAARSTDGRTFPWGDADPSYYILSYLNYRGQDPTPVGSYPIGASPYGILDMAGNVGEWVADWFSIDYYNHPPASNPTGPETGQYRVWRGGSWANTSTEWIRTYIRTGNLPTDYSAGLGFRCARNTVP